MKNPYNVGTPLADVPWRETFADGLTRYPSYTPGLLDVFGVPSAMFTTRVYYNRDLLRTITGPDAVPRSYAEFVALYRKVWDYRTPSGERVLPIAGSQYNAPAMIEALFKSQTQRLRLTMVDDSSLGVSNENVALSYLQKKWSWSDPAIQSGLDLAADVGRYLQPGFLSLRRDDSLFYFVQQKALMISSGSWDAKVCATKRTSTLGPSRCRFRPAMILSAVNTSSVPRPNPTRSSDSLSASAISRNTPRSRWTSSAS